MQEERKKNPDEDLVAVCRYEQTAILLLQLRWGVMRVDGWLLLFDGDDGDGGD